MTSDATNSADLSPVKRALLEIRELRARIALLEAEQAEPIAIVGLSIRAPGGVIDAESFARMLWAGTDAITEIPASRWPLDKWYDEGQDTAGKMYTRFGGFIDDVDQFDAEFFGIAPVEAASMDPQQRLVLELAWQALEDAGHAPSSLAGTNSGIYLGISNSDYGRALFAHPELIDPYFSPGNAYSVAAGRVSYVLGMQGPAISIDTACSSSLVSLHLACQGLRNGECNLALAGGVNLILMPELNVNFSKAGMMSRDGRCRTFDADAAGYVRGEGGGMVVLRRLRDALAGGDRVLAVVRGSAVNQDGRSNGLTAPNGPAQEAVLRAALRTAGVAPSHVGYVEAHGTGTSLGDPIEVNALSAVLGVDRASDSPLLLGSVKTNIGHLEAAAGIAGVIKTVIALQRKEIPPHLHYTTPNPFIDWSAMPMHVPTAVTAWTPIDGKRIAGVSSFGFSGTNAHVILEAAPDADAAAVVTAAPILVLALSARDAVALRALVAQYRDRVQELPEDDRAALADVCFTANSGRSHLAHRVSVSADSATAIVAGLDAWLAGSPHPRVLAGVAASEAPRVAFLFPGQGPQYVGMGRALYDSIPEFRRAFDACADVLDTLLPLPIRPIVFPVDGDSTLLNQTAYAQPAMFAIEHALATLWRAWGVAPSAVMGHSFGEYAAACVAGVVSLADAAKMVVTRGRLVAALPGDGLMTVVEASESEVTDAMRIQGGVVAIAAINGPSTCVISGVRADVDAVAAHFAAIGRRTKALRVSHGFHSPLMDPVLDEFERELSTVRYSAPATSFISNLTGSVADIATIGHARYWRDHLRNPVRFSQSMQVLAAQGITHYVEMSPHPVLLGMAAECVKGGVWLPSMRDDQGALSEMLLALQRVYADGAEIDWAAVSGASRRRVALPTYPFQRKRHWIDAVGSAPARDAPISAPVDFWSSAVPSLDAQALRGPLDLDAGSYAAKWDCLARLTSVLVQQTLRDLGVFVRKGESHTIDTVLDVTGILPAHRQLVSRWLHHLVRDGALRQDGAVFMPRDGKARTPLVDLWAEAEQRFHDNREMLDYVKNCAKLLPGIVTGRESALESLFPGGSFDLATALYEQSATMRYINGLAASAFDAVGKAIPAGAVLRVLEIGAGTGGTSSSLLRVLPADRTDYLFTDVSEAFLERARVRFATYPQVRFGRYDLEQEPALQGYKAGQFDVIVSANCVHAARDLRATLTRLRGLLAPGGLLILVESTVHFDFFDVTTGLIEGWQAFADDLRTDNPLLAPDEWTGAMLAAGFASAQAWPHRESLATALGQHVIVARTPGDVAAATQSESAAPAVRATATATATVAVVTPVVNDFRVRLAIAMAGDRLAMMCDGVRGEVMRILRLDASSPPSRQHRLMDLGMDSLTAVQLRNALAMMLELDKALPSTLIFDYPTIESIATFLLERSGLTATAPLPATGGRQPMPTPAPGSRSIAPPALAASAIAAMSDDEIAAALVAREGGV